MKNCIIIALTILALSLAACSGSGSEGNSLTGAVWKWDSTQRQSGDAISPINSESYTVEFLEDGNAAIKADCNSAGAPYTVDGSKITIGPIASTLVACPAGSLSDVFLAQLETVVSYSFLNDGSLLLNIKENTGNMQFSK